MFIIFPDVKMHVNCTWNISGYTYRTQHTIHSKVKMLKDDNQYKKVCCMPGMKQGCVYDLLPLLRICSLLIEFRNRNDIYYRGCQI